MVERYLSFVYVEDQDVLYKICEHMAEMVLDFRGYVALGVHIGVCRNLPFGGRATRDLRERVPRKEYARSCHQRLFEENIEKTEKDVIYEL